MLMQVFPSPCIYIVHEFCMHKNQVETKSTVSFMGFVKIFCEWFVGVPSNRLLCINQEEVSDKGWSVNIQYTIVIGRVSVFHMR